MQLLNLIANVARSRLLAWQVHHTAADCYHYLVGIPLELLRMCSEFQSIKHRLQ